MKPPWNQEDGQLVNKRRVLEHKSGQRTRKSPRREMEMRCRREGSAAHGKSSCLFASWSCDSMLISCKNSIAPNPMISRRRSVCGCRRSSPCKHRIRRTWCRRRALHPRRTRHAGDALFRDRAPENINMSIANQMDCKRIFMHIHLSFVCREVIGTVRNTKYHEDCSNTSS